MEGIGLARPSSLNSVLESSLACSCSVAVAIIGVDARARVDVLVSAGLQRQRRQLSEICVDQRLFQTRDGFLLFVTCADGA